MIKNVKDASFVDNSEENNVDCDSEIVDDFLSKYC